jgi:hypothetical protein
MPYTWYPSRYAILTSNKNAALRRLQKSIAFAASLRSLLRAVAEKAQFSAVISGANWLVATFNAGCDQQRQVICIPFELPKICSAPMATLKAVMANSTALEE